MKNLGRMRRSSRKISEQKQRVIEKNIDSSSLEEEMNRESKNIVLAK